MQWLSCCGNIMIPNRFHHPSGLLMVVIISQFSLDTSYGASDVPFVCYQGSIESNAKGQIKRHSEMNLASLPCDQPITPTSGHPTTTADTDLMPNSSHPAQPSAATTPANASQQHNASAANFCVVDYFPSGSRLSTNGTWTANFSCVLGTAACPSRTCCKTPNCNTLEFFRKGHPALKTATVSSCHKGNVTGSGPVPAFPCRSGSQYCYNQTTDRGTLFGCSTGTLQISCRKNTVGSNSRCVNASKHSSGWMLVLLITCGFLIGGLVGVVATVLYRRWKKKRRANGPLKISYSRISADCVDDDNVFSY
ncbi:uncharacterized protein LOC110987890 isoform X2 [Acanthaster planci]|uniref:Uncharacterized protein LOC110987890 isoform X2 n=1 Tax=Acanthaster planci TaxID=133434 RepID=A0A8B7ZM84_ACAPL|nr:uncharacterized protein LOC110987890 isoform X2 [Acanthaster planci]